MRSDAGEDTMASVVGVGTHAMPPIVASARRLVQSLAPMLMYTRRVYVDVSLRGRELVGGVKSMSTVPLVVERATVLSTITPVSRESDRVAVIASPTPARTTLYATVTATVVEAARRGDGYETNVTWDEACVGADVIGVCKMLVGDCGSPDSTFVGAADVTVIPYLHCDIVMRTQTRSDVFLFCCCCCCCDARTQMHSERWLNMHV